MGNQNTKEFEFIDNPLLVDYDNGLLDNNDLEISENYEKEKIFLDKNKDTISNISNEKNLSRINKNKKDSNKIPVTFEWENGGNCVLLTGNFCNWNQFFLMEKDSSGKHVLTLYLNKGFIQYKFKVDNEWKYNEKFPVINDNGNLNNYIDTTNWEISFEKSEETTNSNTKSTIKHFNKKSSNINNEFKISQNNFCNYIPQIDEMKKLIQIMPEQYKKEIFLDKKINKIKHRNLFSSEEDNFYEGNYAYKTIKPIAHELINHVNFKSKDVNNDNKKQIIYSIVTRHRLKFTTFFYYKSN